MVSSGAVSGKKSRWRRIVHFFTSHPWTNVDAELGAKLRANLGAAPLSDAANKIG
jgi:hypothetical protein